MALLTHHPPSKEAVLEAAQRLLLQHGYAGLSMRELAKHSGLAKATIYHHFQDKRDIYLSVLERDFNVVRDRISEAAASPGDVPTRLRSVIRTYFDLQRERRLVIMMALREAASMERHICALLRRSLDELIQPIGAILQDGIAAGELRPVNVEMTVLSLLGMLQSYIAHRLLFDDQEIGEDVVEHTLDLLLHGLLVRSPSPNTLDGEGPIQSK
ncbi:MAG TPA: TetR/AcrR family transcriptional regulator [Caldilineaceae bacterium]|nr:TetR/AcrR family transcriptional regulator [Caldilineaceae bacterium]